MVFNIEDTTFENKMNSCAFFIEATDFETLMIYNKKKDYFNSDKTYTGHYYLIGYVDKEETKPVYVLFKFYKVLDSLICFYYPTSNYIDFDMIEDWIADNYPKLSHYGRKCMTDAMNSHTAFTEVEIIHRNNFDNNRMLKELSDGHSNISDNEIPNFVKELLKNIN